MKFKKVNNLGEFGKDYNTEITRAGKYSIPIPNYDLETDDKYQWIDVDIHKVIMPPISRMQCIIGYDENNKSQMEYYNGSQRCFKRIWQDGSMSEEYKTFDHVYEYIVDDLNIKSNAAKALANFFMNL